LKREHPGYLGAQDTYYVGNIKGVGRIYQQTFIDTYTRVAFAKVYDRKNAIAAADLLNDLVLPFFEQQNIPLLRILTDRGTEYKGKREHHEYELYLDIEGIEHSKIQVRSPQSNGICERLHRTIQEEFYAVAFRKNCTNHWTSFKAIWMSGCSITITSDLTLADTALVKHLCKPLMTVSHWLAKKNWMTYL